MTGIVNSTGARSGVIGTTVGTPAGGLSLTGDTDLNLVHATASSANVDVVIPYIDQDWT